MKASKVLFLIIVIALFVGGCRYSFVIPFDDSDNGGGGDIDSTEISFSADIIPIFNDGNYCTSCHTTGKQTPDLTPEKAFSSLNSTKYINKTTPEESRIYKHPHPDTSEHQQKKYNSSQAAKVLAWIKQGAKNN